MEQYKAMVQHVLDHGEWTSNRTGVKTLEVFGYQTRFKLSDGFPLVTLKYTSMRLIVSELLWFLGGTCNKLDLQAADNHIWDEWCAPNPRHEGDMGPIYGVQWRGWRDTTAGNIEYIDQLAEAIRELKVNPTSRRLVISAWNVADIPEMALPPCHVMFQFHVQHGKLSCQIYQRSCDVFLGVPFNIASYALLTIMVAHVTGLEVGDLIWTGGSVHLYENHMDQVMEMMGRDCKPLPQVLLNDDVWDIDSFKSEDVSLVGYKYHPAIKAPVAV